MAVTPFALPPGGPSRWQQAQQFLSNYANGGTTTTGLGTQYGSTLAGQLGPTTARTAAPSAAAASLLEAGGVPMATTAADLSSGLASGAAKWTGSGGRLSQLLGEGLTAIKPSSLASGLAGAGVGIGINYLADKGLDQFIGGEASDPGFSWGGLGKAAGSGALAGGAVGLVAGPTAGISALIGGGLGAGGYLLSELLSKDEKASATPKEAIHEMRSLAAEFGTDPKLVDQIVGAYSLMAKHYQDKGMDKELDALTESTYTQLASVIGQKAAPAPANFADPNTLAQIINMTQGSGQGFADAVSDNSPYKAAIASSASSLPAQLYMAAIQQQQEYDAAMAQAQPQTGLASGLTADQLSQLTKQGIAA